MSESLTSRQRAHLRRLAHSLRPVLHVGRSGVTEALTRSLDQAFTNEELLKVRVLEGAPEEVRRSADALASALPAVTVVQVMGRVVTLYRPNPDKPKINLPD